MTSPIAMQHTFAGNPLDRADAKRRDEEWLAAAYHSNKARVLPFWRQRVLLQVDPKPALHWCSPTELQALASQGEPIFLGLMEDRPHFALALASQTDAQDKQVAPSLPSTDEPTFTDARAAAMSLPASDSGIVAQARAQLEWHRRNRFCGNCGLATTTTRGGHLISCSHCGNRSFPRTDPVVIMLISRGDFCLLGQPNGPIAGSGFYTALAGFVDQGESIEEAVRRETWEEAGIQVGPVQYHSSQPWPFPHSLMIGCHGQAITEDINIDADEMADVRWFSRAETITILAKQATQPARLPPRPTTEASPNSPPPDIVVPGPMAIAHHLISAWAKS